MKALFRNRLYTLVETVGAVAVLVNEEGELTVSLGAPELVVDPTDDEVAGCRDGLTAERARTASEAAANAPLKEARHSVPKRQN